MYKEYSMVLLEPYGFLPLDSLITWYFPIMEAYLTALSFELKVAIYHVWPSLLFWCCDKALQFGEERVTLAYSLHSITE